MLTLDLVVIDTTDWIVHELTPTDRSWFVGGDPHRFRLFGQRCLEDTVEGWRARAERETTAQGGTWLSFDEVSIDGCLAFQGIFKFPAAKALPGFPTDALSVFIVGMIAVPLGDMHLRLNAEALERGTTGLREATFGVMRPKPIGEPTPPVDAEEFFDRVRASLSRALPSDAAEFDTIAPTHPLSRVRAHLRMLRSQLRLAPALKARARPVVAEVVSPDS
jgi:hypothetical protein